MHQFYLSLMFMMVTLGLSSVDSLAQDEASSLAYLSEDLQKYGLKTQNLPEKWEDGMRTTGEKGSYEWWYFDTSLEDGTASVITFHTKDFVQANKPTIAPSISLRIDLPDGTQIKRKVNFKPEEATFSKDSCNATIGKSYFRGNLKEYVIHYEDEELIIDVKLNSTTASWRPKTGHILFGEESDKYFAWVVATPHGTVDFEYTYKGEKKTLKGEGYHDHNWGNTSPSRLFNHWYWSRTQLGPYTIIASEMIASKKYDKEGIIVFNLSKGGKTVADNEKAVTLYRSFGQMHPKKKKDISDDLVFVYDDPNDEYRYEYFLYREKTVAEVDLLAVAVKSKVLYFFARLLTGFDGAYFRFGGTVRLKVYKNDNLVEEYTNTNSIWELMYFGKPNR